MLMRSLLPASARATSGADIEMLSAGRPNGRAAPKLHRREWKPGTGRRSLAVATERRQTVWQRHPARTHRAICDDDYHANLGPAAPLLCADLILGKDRWG